jgi:hypothetical protein
VCSKARCWVSCRLCLPLSFTLASKQVLSNGFKAMAAIIVLSLAHNSVPRTVSSTISSVTSNVASECGLYFVGEGACCCRGQLEFLHLQEPHCGMWWVIPTWLAASVRSLAGGDFCPSQWQQYAMLRRLLMFLMVLCEQVCAVSHACGSAILPSGKWSVYTSLCLVPILVHLWVGWWVGRTAVRYLP